MLLLNRVKIILITILITFCMAKSQVPQTTPVSSPEALAKQIIAATSNEVRQKLIEVHKDLVTPQFFQALIGLASQENDKQRSISTLLFAKQLVRNSKDAESFIRISFELGSLLLVTSQKEEAAKAFEDLRNFLPSVGPLNFGKALVVVGNIYMKNRLYNESLLWYNDAKTLLEKEQGPEATYYLAESWRGSGVAYSETGRFDEALKALQKSEELFAGYPPGLPAVMNDYATIYDKLGNSLRAAQSYSKAIELLEKINPENFKVNIAIIKVNLGLLQTNALGEYEKALKNFADAELILGSTPGYEADLASLYGNKAIALNELGKFEQSLENSKKSLNFFKATDPVSSAIAYNEIVVAQIGLGQYDEALNNAEAAVQSAGVNRIIKQVSLTLKGRVFSGLKRLPEAKEAFSEAISIVEDLTDEAIGDEKAQADFFSRMVYPYRYMADLLLTEGDYENSLLYAERSKAKVVLSSLQGGRNNRSRGMETVQKQQELELIEKLRSTNIELTKKEGDPNISASEKEGLLRQREELRRQLETFRLKIYQSDSVLRSRRVDISQKDLTKLNKVLPDNKTVGLHYVVTPEKVWLLVITRNPNQGIKVNGEPLKVTGKELKQLVENFRSSLENVRAGFDKDAQELYNKLLKPAEAYLIGKEIVTIIPDDILWDLPFQALLDQKGKYFIENHAVFYAPSFFVLSQIREVKASRKMNYKRSLLAFGNPDLGTGTKTNEIAEIMGVELKPLPRAENEVNKICQLFSNCKNSKYIRENATETTVKKQAKGTRFIHFAAHGILDNSSPLYSFVVLSQTGDKGQEDGLLQTWEVMNLDLTSTEMLVLSACETGRGELRSGEGIIGLTWAAFIAGSPTTIATQWKVHSDSTNLLMDNFYKNLFPRKSKNFGINHPTATSKAKAMQKAMKELLKLAKQNKIKGDYKHPYFWAGFIVVGDDK